MLKIVQYEKKFNNLWDKFIANSKNGTFLFYRNYLEYHQDRFTDFSLMFFQEDNLIAVMPANIKNKEVFSHQGLTFGGIISNNKMKASIMLEIFQAMKNYLKELDISTLIYKAIPYIYHSVPSEEDLYALFINNSSLIRRDVSSTIYLKNKLNFSKGRKWILSKSKAYQLEVKRSYDFQSFMEMEEYLLMNKYKVKPTHTADEIELLANRFPENIKLFTCTRDNILLGGVIVYESKNVAHAQYISSIDEGREIGALDIIINFLINDYYKEKSYFDFGISTEKNGQYLNIGLIHNKETYGARSVVYDVYKMSFI